MKKHLVTLWFRTPDGNHYCAQGYVKHKKGDNGKSIVYPGAIFKKHFGFPLPLGSTISMK